jgi:Tfp pilus assembly protein PilN
MAVKLNLLPQGTSISGSLGKALKLTKMLGVIAAAFFLVFALGLSALFILNTITLNRLNSDVNTLKGQITALESTEQKAVLLKDRLSKIKTALLLPSAVPNLDKVNSLVAALPPATILSELNVDPQKVDLTIRFNATGDLSTFMKSLATSKSFTSVVLTTFGYNPSSGYTVGVRLSSI